jgi:hypothetical protein
MKYLKTYKDKRKIKENYYVLLSLKNNIPGIPEQIINFLNNNIGQIYYIPNPNTCTIYYENVPEDIKQDFSNWSISKNHWTTDIDKIKIWAENKEDLEIYLNTKKYNI